jgi:quinoprotein glucose dehydrogenase
MAAPAILVTVLLVTSASAATLPSEPERWLRDLAFPVNMAWASDGTLFFAEKETGDVRQVVDGRVVADPVTHVDVTLSNETGLLGIAVHPAWPDEPWVYLYYSDAADGRNRLIRVRVQDGREIARETLLDALPTATAYHNGGDMLFGPDGMLYLTVGEAHEPERAQDPADLGGKVLRVTPTGGIPPDNPIEGSRTFTLGHRNSFGLCVDPETGELWETENGPGGGDEENHLVAGANYGWPEAMGPLDDQRFTDPSWFYPGTIVPTGCAVWRGALYMATYGDGVLRRFPLDGGAATRVFPFGEPVYDLVVGPDDRLYASTGSAIWRFGTAPETTTPDDEAFPTAVDAGLPGWVLIAVALAVAASLAATLRLAARRR